MKLSNRGLDYIDGFLGPLEAAVADIAVKVAGAVFIELVRTTVVDSGRAAANWRIDYEGSQQFVDDQGTYPVGNSWSTPEQRSTNAAAVLSSKMSELGLLMTDLRFGETIHIYNPIPAGEYERLALSFTTFYGQEIDPGYIEMQARAIADADYPGWFK